MPSIKSEKRKTTKLNKLLRISMESVFKVRSLKTSTTVAGVLFLINQYKQKQ